MPNDGEYREPKMYTNFKSLLAVGANPDGTFSVVCIHAAYDEGVRLLTQDELDTKLREGEYREL